MNESFEVILTHEEFTRYKQLQKEHQRNCRALREAQQQHEKSSLLCEELHATVAAHQLKIKELSKTTLRLSRKILFEEEEHQKTQEHFLAREQELLEKLLAATQNNQNTINSMKKDKENKERAAEDNQRLTKKLAEMEKHADEAKIEAAIEKDRARQAEMKCEVCERQLLETAKEMNRLKAQLQQMSIEGLRLSSENSSICKQLSTLKAILKEEKGKNEEMRQLHSQERKQLQQQKTALEQQVELLQSLNHKHIAAFEEKSIENKQLLEQRQVFLQRNSDLSTNVEMLQEKMNEMNEQLYAQRQETQRFLLQRQQVQRQLQLHTQQSQQQIAQVQADCVRQLQEERKRVFSKEEMKDRLWRSVRAELDKCMEYLKRDRVAEWQKVLRLELQQITQQLTNHLSASLQQLLNDH